MIVGMKCINAHEAFPCYQHKTDCNNYVPMTGVCIALSNTMFDKDCPFYCSVKDTAEKDYRFHAMKGREDDYV